MKEIYYDECYPSKYGVRKKFYKRQRFLNETSDIVSDETTCDNIDYNREFYQRYMNLWNEPTDEELREWGVID